ncbi:unnamed protein product [Closterium sp. NIES-65]|nr:unnamed protein product [Closterium sp. NIES-65]
MAALGGGWADALRKAAQVKTEQWPPFEAASPKTERKWPGTAFHLTSPSGCAASAASASPAQLPHALGAKTAPAKGHDFLPSAKHSPPASPNTPPIPRGGAHAGALPARGKAAAQGGGSAMPAPSAQEMRALEEANALLTALFGPGADLAAVNESRRNPSEKRFSSAGSAEPSPRPAKPGEKPAKPQNEQRCQSKVPASPRPPPAQRRSAGGAAKKNSALGAQSPRVTAVSIRPADAPFSAAELPAPSIFYAGLPSSGAGSAKGGESPVVALFEGEATFPAIMAELWALQGGRRADGAKAAGAGAEKRERRQGAKKGERGEESAAQGAGSTLARGRGQAEAYEQAGSPQEPELAPSPELRALKGSGADVCASRGAKLTSSSNEAVTLGVERAPAANATSPVEAEATALLDMVTKLLSSDQNVTVSGGDCTEMIKGTVEKFKQELLTKLPGRDVGEVAGRGQGEGGPGAGGDGGKRGVAIARMAPVKLEHGEEEGVREGEEQQQAFQPPFQPPFLFTGTTQSREPSATPGSAAGSAAASASNFTWAAGPAAAPDSSPADAQRAADFADDFPLPVHADSCLNAAAAITELPLFPASAAAREAAAVISSLGTEGISSVCTSPRVRSANSSFSMSGRSNKRGRDEGSVSIGDSEGSLGGLLLGLGELRETGAPVSKAARLIREQWARKRGLPPLSIPPPLDLPSPDHSPPADMKPHANSSWVVGRGCFWQAELRASIFEVIDDKDKTASGDEQRAVRGGCSEQAKNLHDSKTGHLLTALLCEYLEWGEMDHTLKVYLSECNLPPVYPRRPKLEDELGLPSSNAIMTPGGATRPLLHELIDAYFTLKAQVKSGATGTSSSGGGLLSRATARSSSPSALHLFSPLKSSFLSVPSFLPPPFSTLPSRDLPGAPRPSRVASAVRSAAAAAAGASASGRPQAAGAAAAVAGQCLSRHREARVTPRGAAAGARSRSCRSHCYKSLPVFCCAPPLARNAVSASGSGDEENPGEFTAVYPSDLHIANPKVASTADETEKLRKDEKDRQRRRQRTCCCRITCWSLIVLTVVIVGLGVAGLVAYLTVSKQQPEVKVKQINILRVGITKSGGGFLGLENFRLGLSALINVTALVYNPNNWDVEAENISVDVKFFDMNVTNVTIPGVVGMSKGGSAELTVPIDIVDAPLATLSPASLLTTPLLHGRAEMRVVVGTAARVKYWGISSPRVMVHVECTMQLDPFSAKKYNEQCTPSISL